MGGAPPAVDPRRSDQESQADRMQVDGCPPLLLMGVLPSSSSTGPCFSTGAKARGRVSLVWKLRGQGYSWDKSETGWRDRRWEFSGRDVQPTGDHVPERSGGPAAMLNALS